MKKGVVMKTKSRNILVGVALCLSGGLLAMNSISRSSPTDKVQANAGSIQDRSASVDRFASNTSYCKAFTGAQDVGTDGVSAEFSAALGDAIHANGDDVKSTFSRIREKCKVVA